MPSDTSRLASAMRNYAVTFPSITDLLGQDDDGTPWIFVDNLFAVVESTSKSAIVISESGPWATPNMHNTMDFPRFIVNIWSDPTRDPTTKAVITPDAKIKAKAVFDAFNAVFHDTEHIHQQWDGVRVIDSLLRERLTYLPVRDGQNMINAQAIYGATIG